MCQAQSFSMEKARSSELAFDGRLAAFHELSSCKCHDLTGSRSCTLAFADARRPERRYQWSGCATAMNVSGALAIMGVIDLFPA
jgi:hypothetical protein